MSSDLTEEALPVTQQQMQAAAADACRLEPEFQTARRLAQGDRHTVLTLQRTIAHYGFLLKFRGVGHHYELWPVGVITVIPFTAGALLWVAAFTLGFGVPLSVLCISVGVLLTGALCAHFLWRPRTADIQRRLPRLQADLAEANAVSHQSTARLQAVEQPYLAAKARHRQLTDELARYEERQRQRQTEQERQEKRERQRFVQSLQHRRQQLFERNWKAMRSVEFEQFLKEVFEALGYQVETTKVTGDQGVDLVVYANGRRTAVQIKGYVNSVSNSAIQEAHTGMVHYKCQDCAVITNSRFTISAVQLAKSVGCTLIDKDRMKDFVMGAFRL